MIFPENPGMLKKDDYKKDTKKNEQEVRKFEIDYNFRLGNSSILSNMTKSITQN